ncbi:MAG: hypothetical protein JRH15_15200 [Deltaproteobacteria bacterium]|nr:hypothetical protein [Deltaproteobacteria bacterium]
MTNSDTQNPELQVIERKAGGATVKAEDGFDLWFDAWGEGPGIIFPARSPEENRSYAEALSDAYRVVIFEPRACTMDAQVALDQIPDADAKAAAGAHLVGRNIEWDPSGYDQYPIDLVISDLHRVADAAGIDNFVLAGYSGMARMSAFLSPYSDQAVGVITGGYHILGAQDYWVGFLAGASALMLSNPDTPALARAMMHLNLLQVTLEQNRDDEVSYANMTGPKIVWIGSQDGEPDDELLEVIAYGSKTAQRVRSTKAEYERLGFQFFQLDGLAHQPAYEAVDKAAPLLRQALIKAGYK